MLSGTGIFNYISLRFMVNAGKILQSHSAHLGYWCLQVVSYNLEWWKIFGQMKGNGGGSCMG